MDEDSRARLLTPPHSFAVVHLPGRRHPGVVVQGDTLNGLIRDLERARSGTEPAAEIGFILEQLREVRLNYERVCKERGVDLPY